MKTQSHQPPSRGVTLLDVLWVIGAVLLVLLLAALLLPRLAGGGPSKMFVCLYHLKQVGLGDLVWKYDNSSLQLPALASTNAGGLRETLQSGGLAAYTQALSNVLASPKVLICPSDDRRKPALSFASLAPANMSYFLNASADFSNVVAVLHGDRHLQSSPAQTGGRILLATNMLVDWSKKSHPGTASPCGNVSLVDGSAQHLPAGATTTAVFSAPVHEGHVLILP